MHLPPAPILMSSVTSWSQSVHIFLGWSRSSWNPDLEAPSYAAADIQADNLTLTRSSFWAVVHEPACVGFALTSLECASYYHLTVPLTRLSLGLCPPVYCPVILEPLHPMPPELLCSSSPEACLPSSPHPCLDLSLSPGLMPHCSTWWASCSVLVSFC